MSNVAGRRLRGKDVDLCDPRFGLSHLRPPQPKRNKETGLLEFAKPRKLKRLKRLAPLKKPHKLSS